MDERTVESRVLAFIERHRLIVGDETVVVGVSGGADSLCLLQILNRWHARLGIGLHIAHLNHQLRGAESEGDAEYVSALAASLAVPVTIGREDVAAYGVERACSLEEAARELRYRFLVRVAGEVGACRVAVGHTRDDQVETILMHVLRGTGTSGLRGLLPCRPLTSVGQEGVIQPGDALLIRPLLEVGREDTVQYCCEQHLDPRVDVSNLSLSFLRNRLRLQLLPALREYNPAVDRALLRLADVSREDIAFIELHASRLWDEVASEGSGVVRLDAVKIANSPVALQRQLVRMGLGRVVGDVRDIDINHVEAVRGLLERPVGKRLCLPHGLICWREYDRLTIGRLPPDDSAAAERPWTIPVPFPRLEGEHSLNVPGETVLPGWRVKASVLGRQEIASLSSSIAAAGEEEGCCHFVADFDMQRTAGNLFVRARRPGDRFYPLGMNMSKKLQDFMVDVRVPRSWRDHIPIVSSEQHIVWVVGWRIDERSKVTMETEHVLRLEFSG